MKRTKSILAVALALVLVLATGLVDFAAGGSYSITIKNDAPGHTYEAYQIFAGDLFVKEDGTKVLSNIVWGKGVSDAVKSAIGDAADVAKTITNEDEAKDFAKRVAPYLETPDLSNEQAAGKYVISGLEAGYYLVKDSDNALANTDDFKTAYIMEVVGDVEATPKGDKPSLDKQVKNGGEWNVVGDGQIGDTVEFRIITTVPDTKEYTKYDYIIHDTMSDGLTSNVKSVVDVTIKVNDGDVVLGTDYYTVDATGNTFSITVNILKAVEDGKIKAGDVLYTYYTGVINDRAKVYDVDSENNTAYLVYSNNPNNNVETGETTEKKVYEWTYKMTVNKVDGQKQPLNGAKFVLSRNGELNVEDLNCDENGVPTVTADLIGLVKIDGGYRVAKADDTDIVYVIDAGKAVIKGLDAGVTYYLYETKTPEGYNSLKAPVEFVINAEYTDNGATVKNVSATVGGTAADGLQADIVNNAGSELPSTGGIGTTIFYIVGAILVVAAGVLLITKKRMSKAAD